MSNLYEEKFKEIIHNEPGLRSPAHSLLDFYKRDVESRLPGRESVLELGTGISPLIESLDDFSIREGVDISNSAIEFCKTKGSGECFYHCEELKMLSRDIKYDLIVDGHSFHCLTTAEDRKISLERVKAHLKPGGIFMLEMGVRHKSFEAFLPYTLIGDTLFKLDHPVRYCPNGHEIEQLIIESGLQICLYFVYSHKKMIYDDSRDEPLDTDLDIVQLLALNPA